MHPLPEVLHAAAALAEGELSPEVRERTRWVLADTVTVMIAAARRQPASDLGAPGLTGGAWTDASRSAAAPSRVLGRDAFAASDRAAFLNAAGLTDLEMDEGTRPTGHPAAHILPALLAVAEAIDATVDQVERSLVFGYEVAGWLLEAHRLRAGVHPHGHLVAIAAATAVAHLAARDVGRAAGIAATMAMRMTAWSAPIDGADARNLWVAGAASDAVTVLRLLETGWTGSTTVLTELFDGVVADLVGAELPDPAAPRIMRGYFKVYPACALTHSSIEAALAIGRIDAAEIESITVSTTANAMKIAAQPQDARLARRFSIPFAVSTALLARQLTIDAFDVPLPGAVELARLVTVVEDQALTDMWPVAAPSVVEVGLRDGSIVTGRCDDPKGARPDSIGTVDLRQKSVALLGDGGCTWDALESAARATRVVSMLDGVG